MDALAQGRQADWRQGFKETAPVATLRRESLRIPEARP